MPPLPGSLANDKLRASLFGLVLLTNLSKEAEVELRAYLERRKNEVKGPSRRQE